MGPRRNDSPRGRAGLESQRNGGVLATVDDLYRYELALTEGRLISHAIQAKQFAEQFRRTPNLGHGYDRWIEAPGEDGVQLNRAGDGPSTGVSAEYRRYPRDSLIFILLANNRHHGWSTRRYVMRALRRLYRGDSILLPAVRSGGAEVDAIAGTYAVDSSAYFVTIAVYPANWCFTCRVQTYGRATFPTRSPCPPDASREAQRLLHLVIPAR